LRKAAAITLILTIMAFSLMPALGFGPPAAPSEAPPPYGFRDAGPAPPNMTVTGVIYVPLRNLPLIFYYAQAVSAPGSPLYHRFLTPGQVRDLFYPTQEFNETLAHLRSYGLRVLLTAADSIIVFQGQAWQVERAFGVRVDIFTNGSVSFYEDVGPVAKGPWAYPYVSNATMLVFDRPQFLLTAREAAAVLSRLEGVNVSFPLQAYPMTALAQAYNATALYSQGFNGSGVTVGVLEFYGDPTLSQDLAYFDEEFGLPPANVTVVPIGSYNPNLGVITGWALEEDLDVEAIHSMAPGARILVYVANGELPLSAAIAFIDGQDQVSVLGQSFGVPEAFLSSLGWSFFYYNVYLSDVYYALGAAEGITFVASSGDGGGMGYSAGPIGDVPYPASSPWVLAVGGTTTYISGDSSLQTAWSSMGFDQLLQALGGSTGGYSAVEPMPWWQEGVAPAPPQGFPYGRAVPDVAAQASLFPGSLMVGEGNQTLVVGGTSESAELVVGLLALLAQASGSRLGLIAPLLYGLYSSGDLNAFEPVTFGYNVPWAAGRGYNLVTGLGALNVGELAKYLEARAGPASGPLAEVLVNGNYTAFMAPGQPVNVSVKVGGPYSSNCSLEAYVVSLEGVAASATMMYNSTLGLWEAELTAPSNASGVVYIEVGGECNGAAVRGLDEAFLGYFGSAVAPVPLYPYAPQLGMPVAVFPVSPMGNMSLSVAYNVTVLEYRPLNNTYGQVISVPAMGGNVTELYFNASPGYAVLWLRGPVYGFVPFFIGSSLQYYFMVLPQVFSQPGSAYPGGWVLIEGLPVPPVETLFIPSNEVSGAVFWAAAYGSNVTAELVAPNGTVLSEASLPMTYQGYYAGLLRVPQGLPPGYYLVVLRSSYNSTGAGMDIEGYGVGMIYVAPELRASVQLFPSALPEGGEVEVMANITYPNGTPVRFGLFSATLLPAALTGLYENVSYSTEVPLQFSDGAWEAEAYLPGPSSIGNATYYEGAYGGEWAVVVTGEGAWGDQLPYSSAYAWLGRNVVYRGVNLTSGFETSGAVFEDVTIMYNGTILWSLMEGLVRVVSSRLTLSYVDSQGVIVAVNSNLTLRYSTASALILIDSRATLEYSDVGEVIVGPGSNVSVTLSRVGKVVNGTAWSALMNAISQAELLGLSGLESMRPQHVTPRVITTTPIQGVTKTQQVAALREVRPGQGWALTAAVALSLVALAIMIAALTLTRRKS